MGWTKRAPTAEQKAKAEERRAGFRALARNISAMSADQRMAMAAQMAATVTIEGRALSVHNSCLVAAQHPDATVVGGFQQWRRAGRVVRKGEHGFMVWAPAGARDKGERIDGQPEGAPVAEGAEAPGRMRFVMVTLFDVAQTDEAGQGAAPMVAEGATSPADAFEGVAA